DFGRGRRLYVARGDPRKGPLTLAEIDPDTGGVIELFRAELERPEAVELEIADVDRDQRPDLAFAYYATRTHVRTHHLRADGRVVEGALERTAQARAFADLDGDGVTDAIVGRLYGDGEGAAPGDLKVDVGHGPVDVPARGGVRAVATWRGADGKTALYFADGWSASYVKDGRARIERATWNGAGFDVVEVATSPEEYTFFSLRAVPRRGDAALVAAGNRGVTLFEPGPAPRGARPLGGPGKGVTAACRAGPSGFSVWAPGAAVHALPVPTPR
ncbi:MAG TPA: VCBS repeat-containing protein, partial [Minicystis sp.]|nr:VCBS repeat-containing protein [Minicystis sp.]